MKKQKPLNQGSFFIGKNLEPADTETDVSLIDKEKEIVKWEKGDILKIDSKDWGQQNIPLIRCKKQNTHAPIFSSSILKQITLGSNESTLSFLSDHLNLVNINGYIELPNINGYSNNLFLDSFGIREDKQSSVRGKACNFFDLSLALKKYDSEIEIVPIFSFIFLAQYCKIESCGEDYRKVPCSILGAHSGLKSAMRQMRKNDQGCPWWDHFLKPKA